MKFLYALLICVLLSGCGISAKQPTATATAIATSTETLTPQPNLTATNRANQAATQTMRVNNSRATLTEIAGPTVTAIAKAANALGEISAAANGIDGLDLSKAKLVFGPTSDKLVQKNDKYVEVYSPDLSLKNFVATITFVNPYDPATIGNWDYGIFFRNNHKDVQYRLVILSNQTWTLIDSKAKSYVDSNSSKELTINGGEKNTIWLIVVNDMTHLFINGVFVKSMPVKNLVSGDITPATGIYYGNAKNQKATEFRDFVVWSLP